MSTYCVIFREPVVDITRGSRTTRLYLSAASAERALLAAAQENPQCRVLGVEPGQHARLTRDDPHAA